MKALLAKLGILVDQAFIPLVETGLRIVVILLLAWGLWLLGRRALRLFRAVAVKHADGPDDVRRADTLYRALRYLLNIVIAAVVIMLVLSNLGISIAPVLGAAGVVGIAVGFGAQSLVKDYFNGFTLLLENEIRIGDFVEVAGKGGHVEEMTLRHVRLRDPDGNVHFVPTGMIDTVTNKSLDWAYAVADVGVAYGENLDAVYAAMLDCADALRADAAWGPRILERLEIQGVEKWDSSALVIRCRFKTAPLAQWDVRREFMRRLKFAFDAAGIEIPYPHVTLYAGRLKHGETPALPVAVRRDRDV
jgi:small conductance mechanosensitive channel